MTREAFALYIHVPFCSRKCPYCDFNTYATLEIPEEDYAQALLAELDRYAQDSDFSGRVISSIFWGGGTPSLLSPNAIRRVLDRARDNFGIARGAEVTLEANPSQPSKERYAAFCDAGINRVSFGVQSFDQDRLDLLGRDHTAQNACDSVASCVDAGIGNVSVDIIFGVANQTVEDLERDLSVAANLPITHLSTYALTIEPGTPFYQRQERGLLKAPTDDVVAAMLRGIPEYLAPHGFERYEISNYARKDLKSAHNEAYWIGRDYLGIGAGAHSYLAKYEGARRIGASRWSTLALPASFMRAAGTNGTISWREDLGAESIHFEFFYLGLRRTCGVSLTEFEDLFGFSPRSRYGDVVSQLESEGFITDTGSGIALTKEGIALADSVYERFLL